MDILDLMDEVQEQFFGFKTHPAKNAEETEKMLYLKGLSLYAVVDGEITSAEKTYIATVCSAIAVDSKELEGIYSFGAKPDKETITKIFDELNRSDLKYSFAIDCLVLRDTDGAQNEKEEKMTATVYKMLKLSVEGITAVEAVYNGFVTRDYAKIHTCTGEKFYVGKQLWEHLFEQFSVDLEKYLSDLKESFIKDFEFDFTVAKLINPSYSYGYISQNINLGKQYITNKIFSQLLTDLYSENKIEVQDDIITDEFGSYLITLSKNNIKFESGMFLTVKSSPAVGLSVLAAEKFVEWLNNKTGKIYSIPSFTVDDESNLESSKLGYSDKDIDYDLQLSDKSLNLDDCLIKLQDEYIYITQKRYTSDKLDSVYPQLKLRIALGDNTKNKK